MLLRRPGQRVARHPLQVGLQFGITARDLGEELPPGRAIALRHRRGHLRHPILTPMRSQVARAQVDYPAGGIERPHVSIPLVGRGRVLGVRTGDLLDRGDGRRARQLGLLPRRFRLERGCPADPTRQVGDVEQLVGIPAHAGPHQPLAPQGAVAPVVAIAAREGRGQPVLGFPIHALQHVCRHGVVHLRHHGHPRAGCQVAADVEPLFDRVGCIPALRLVVRRQQDGHQQSARLQDRLRRPVGVLPARLVPVGPDQHGLAGQRRPVGLLHGCVRAVHRRGGDDAGVDQGLGALLALDQHDLRGGRQSRLVVQRTRIGRGHLAALGVPRPELLAPAGRVVAVDHPDQPAGGVQVVPLGGLGAEVVRRRLAALAAHRLRAGETEQVGGARQHPREFRVHVDTQGACDHGEHIPAVARGAVRPQARLLPVEHDFQAVARVALDVADHEGVPPLLAGRKQDGQHRVQPVEQQAPDALPLPFRGSETSDLPALQWAVIEVEHGRSGLAVRQGLPGDSRS